ncbi:hypothetical protein [Aquimarina algicola]|uniref:Uncharacterized protein n=1 Tax=Aquimarina algicola TaxID=2589995 RepID=A0A504JC84_9FLAO|nr:hypothetical protein [Aquimarina algicola]TPN86182.1 hypothetical protein FHK87_13000 [Aquimarina algicola]
MSDIYRKCQDCGTFTLNEDYCQQCGAIINTQLKRKLQREHQAIEREKRAQSEKPNAVTLFFQNAMNHSNIFIRLIVRFFYSIWVIVLAIGSFIAFLIGYIAA